MNQAGSTPDSSLLLTLEEISQLVSHSHDPGETLDNIVALIQNRYQTAVCSVYLLEPERNELVLSATVGLKRESVGRVRMRIDEGLTGLVAERMAPVAVADAFQHPRFKYFADAGEDRYHSFLGVPLVEGGALQGVLVVQTVEPRTFTPSEVRMLVTVAAQLASLVGDAHLLEQVAAAAHAQSPPLAEASPVQMSVFKGVALSPGRGMGHAYVIDGLDEWRKTATLTSNDKANEKKRLDLALTRAREELARLSHRISELVGEDHGAILQAQLMILQDRTIESDLNACVEAGASAEGALIATLNKYVAAFQKLTTPYFQERVYDIKDVFNRLIWQLRPREKGSGGITAESERVILVAREASVMELFAVDLDQLSGVVVEHGGPQSHAAILARTLGIPMVGQIPDLTTLIEPGRPLLVDGTTGRVMVDPDATETIAGAAVPHPSTVLTEMPAGLPRVEVNLNLLFEVRRAVAQGAGGVGLFRSEFLFLARRTLPTEEEQFNLYRKLLTQLDGRPATIRTFDLRPDKLAAYTHLGAAAARPFDWRLVLDSPPLQKLFLDQIRAVLRAATVGPVRLLIPLVWRTELLDFILETVARAREELGREGLPYSSEVPLGIMIEVAAAAPLVRLWAERVAFFALGTNDLTASALGVDRDDPAAAGLTDSLHPGLLQIIEGVVRDAHAADRPVTVCGEMAADPLGAAALAALGVDALSVPVNQFQATRRSLAKRSAAALHALRPRLLAGRTSAEVRALLQNPS